MSRGSIDTDSGYAEVSVGRLVAERPAAAAVLEKLGIDYCCGGDRPLSQACEQAGVSLEKLLEQIAREESQAQAADEPNWLERSLSELCDHIEQTHHVYLKQELPRLTELIDKVVAAHAEHHPELRDVQQVFAALRAELETHMMKEERILFPAIRQMEQAGGPLAFPFGSVGNPIRVMEHEHDSAADALRRLRSLTSDYRLPEDGCNAYAAMLNALQRLEGDLHRHIHKENNILFPRALQLEGHGSAQ